MMKKIGRPKLPRGTARTEAVAVRVTQGERRRIEEAAERDGIGLSKWIRMVVMNRVREWEIRPRE